MEECAVYGEWELPRDEWQDSIASALERCGFDTYGRPCFEGLKPYVLHDGTSGCDFGDFLVRAYYWGDNETLFKLPNFEDRKRDIKIHWYKYPLRGNYCNQEMDFDGFCEMVDDFEQTVKALVDDIPQPGEDGFDDIYPF